MSTTDKTSATKPSQNASDPRSVPPVVPGTQVSDSSEMPTAVASSLAVAGVGAAIAGAVISAPLALPIGLGAAALLGGAAAVVKLFNVFGNSEISDAKIPENTPSASEKEAFQAWLAEKNRKPAEGDSKENPL